MKLKVKKDRNKWLWYVADVSGGGMSSRIRSDFDSREQAEAWLCEFEKQLIRQPGYWQTAAARTDKAMSARNRGAGA